MILGNHCKGIDLIIYVAEHVREHAKPRDPAVAEGEGQLKTEGTLPCFFHESVQMIFGGCGRSESELLVRHLDIITPAALALGICLVELCVLDVGVSNFR